jgi:hypothetical protein
MRMFMGRHAIVIGAGIGGLSALAVSARPAFPSFKATTRRSAGAQDR